MMSHGEPFSANSGTSNWGGQTVPSCCTPACDTLYQAVANNSLSYYQIAQQYRHGSKNENLIHGGHEKHIDAANHDVSSCRDYALVRDRKHRNHVHLAPEVPLCTQNGNAEDSSSRGVQVGGTASIETRDTVQPGTVPDSHSAAAHTRHWTVRLGQGLRMVTLGKLEQQREWESSSAQGMHRLGTAREEEGVLRGMTQPVLRQVRPVRQAPAQTERYSERV